MRLAGQRVADGQHVAHRVVAVAQVQQQRGQVALPVKRPHLTPGQPQPLPFVVVVVQRQPVAQPLPVRRTPRPVAAAQHQRLAAAAQPIRLPARIVAPRRYVVVRILQAVGPVQQVVEVVCSCQAARPARFCSRCTAARGC